MRRLSRDEPVFRPFTHREVPLQVGLEFTTLEDNWLRAGGVEDVATPLVYEFENPLDLPEWYLREGSRAPKRLTRKGDD